MLVVSRNIQRLKDESGKTKLTFGTPKSEKSKRKIPLLPELIDGLHRHRIKQEQIRTLAGKRWKEHGLIFSTEIGTPIDPSNFWRFLDKISTKAKIDRVNVHALRHAFASNALERGIGMKMVSDVLGHSSIKVTADIYTHVSQAHMAQEMQKLNGLLKMGKKKLPKPKAVKKNV